MIYAVIFLFVISSHCVHSLQATSLKTTPVWGCGIGSHKVDNDSVSIVQIDYKGGYVGNIQTPSFPDRFQLPLRCVWIFNNTEAKRTTSQFHLHLYLTQFYISRNLFTIATFNNTSDVINLTNNLTWAQINAVGTKWSPEWYNVRHFRSDDDVILLKLNIDSLSYDNLHMRVLEIDDVYGFNITYEVSENPKRINNSCSLLECNFNGECFADLDESRTKLGGFHCLCASPKFSPTVHDEPFWGDRCQYHSKHHECKNEQSQICKNGGTCRYYTSRYVSCLCPPEWSGNRCQIPTHVYENRTNAHSENEGKCISNYAKLEIHRAIAEKVLENANLTSSTNMVKINDPKSEFSTVFFRSNNQVDEVYIDDLKKKLKEVFNEEYKPETTHFCVDQAIRLTSEQNMLHVSEGDEFSLTCIAKGYKKPVFFWKKDFEYKIDTMFSKAKKHPTHISNFLHFSKEQDGRYISIYNWPQVSTNWSVLTLKPANKFDGGTFTCYVYETLHDGINLTDLSKFPFQSASIKVDVLTKPKIEVFPRSTTLIVHDENQPQKVSKSKRHRHPSGHNTLNCFAANDVDLTEAKNYQFFWQKNGVNITSIANRTEHEEIMIQPHGKSLKLGLLEVSATYTCITIDIRDPKLSVNISVNVYVAKDRSQVCSMTELGEIMLPVTLKGTTAIIKCIKGSGYMTNRCLPQTFQSSSVVWSGLPLDMSECLSSNLEQWSTFIERLLSGYLKSKSDIDRLHAFIREFKTNTMSKNLTKRELSTVLMLLSKMFWAILTKPIQLNYSVMAEDFYYSCFPIIVTSQLSLPPSSSSPSYQLDSMLDTFEILRSSTLVFGSKLASGSKLLNSSVLVNGTKNLSTLTGTTSFGWFEPMFSGCFVNKTVVVKLVKIAPSPKNGYEKIWTHPAEASSSDDVNQIPGHTDTQDHSAGKFCAGSTRIGFNLASPYPDFLFRANPILSIIHFKSLEDILNTAQKYYDPVSHTNRRFIRNSSLVTFVYGQDPSYDTKPQLNLTIRFLDAVYPSANESLKYNLSCARVVWQKPIGGSIWIRSDDGCRLQWHPEGMTCICNSDGTYGLVRSWMSEEDNPREKFVNQSSFVILCCGVSLTLMGIAEFFIVDDVLKRPSILGILTLQINSFLILAILIVVISLSGVILEPDNFCLGVALQFFLTTSQSCLVAFPCIVYNKAVWSKVGNFYNKIIVALCYIIPVIYMGFTLNFYEWDSEARMNENPTRSWFVKRGSPHFMIYLLFISLVVICFSSITLFVLQKLPKTSEKYLERKKTLMTSGFLMGAIYLLNLSILFHVNEVVSRGKEIILGMACFVVGTVVFVFFILKRDFKFGKKGTSYLELTKFDVDGMNNDRFCIDMTQNGPDRQIQDSDSKRNIYHVRNSSEKNVQINHDSALCNGGSSEPNLRLLAKRKISETSNHHLDTSKVDPSEMKKSESAAAFNPITMSMILEMSDISHLSPVPLAELLKNVDEDEQEKSIKAEVHSEQRPHRKPRTLTGRSNDSSCSSNDSAFPRSRKTTESGQTTRSLSNASDHKQELAYEGIDESDGVQTAGYVLMSAQISPSQNRNTVLKKLPSMEDRSESSSDPETEHGSYKENRSDIEMSNGPYSEQDSSDHIDVTISALPGCNLSAIFDKPEYGRMKRRRTKKTLAMSKSLPVIFTQKWSEPKMV